MNILSISKAQKEFNGEVLFKNISFDINSKDKVAIIGKNGTGKSTLLKMILGDEDIDAGEIHRNPKAKIGYLSQSVISSAENTLLEEILQVYKNLLSFEKRLSDLALELEKTPEDKTLMNKYAKIEHSYSVEGGYDYLYQVDMILNKFGFKKEEYDRKIQTFSGGEKTRVAFAKLLLQKPELLILDEPTNHLDIEIIDWLEDYLNRYEGAVLIVTHDKYFISKVCRKIIEIDNFTSEVYYGTFADYEYQKVKRYELLVRKYNKQQKEIAHLQSFIDRFSSNAKKASIAKDRQKKMDKIEKLARPHLSKKEVKMTFEEKRSTREIILTATDLSIGYDKPLISNINFTMRGFEKLAIVGPNGTGKTTLLKVIENKIAPLKGKVEFLRKYNIGYFDQNQETLHYHKNIFEEIHDYHPMYTVKDIRSVAAKFLFFNDDLDKPISILSGGERVRLVLLLLMLENPDLLILDEPTNHLDIQTKDIIEDVLSQFTGPIIFVSHDRYFINKIATKIVHLSTTEAIEFEGSYDQFKDQESNKIIKTTRIRNNKQKKVNYDKQLLRLEKQISKLLTDIETNKQDTFKEENYNDHKIMKILNDKINKQEEYLQEIEQKYFDLLEMSEREEVL